MDPLQPMPQIGGMGGAPMPNYPARDGIASAMLGQGAKQAQGLQQDPIPGFVGGAPPLPGLPQPMSGLSPQPAAQGPSVGVGQPQGMGLGMTPPGQLPRDMNPMGMNPMASLGQLGQPKMPAIG